LSVKKTFSVPESWGEQRWTSVGIRCANGRHRVDIRWTFSGYRVAGGESGTGGLKNLSKVGRQKKASGPIHPRDVKLTWVKLSKMSKSDIERKNKCRIWNV